MTFLATIKDKLADRAAEGIAASLTVLLVWAAYQVAPAVLPAIEAVTSKRALLALLVTSLVLNFVFVLVAFFSSKKAEFRIKYGIYWDREKNPHCPACKIPIGGYAEYSAGKGYYCKPCNKIFRLTDVAGKDIDPMQAVSEL
jgi:hypothetical protein